MSDAAITVVISGAVQITLMVVGLLTLWIKLKYGVEKAEEAAHKTVILDKKMDVIAKQTDGLAKALAKESKSVGYAEGAADEKAKNGGV